MGTIVLKDPKKNNIKITYIFLILDGYAFLNG